MYRPYCIVGSDTNTASTTQAGITSTAAIQPRIKEVVLGCSATPGDQAALYQLKRYTAAGTSTSYTPAPLNPGEAAATAIAGVNHSVEPTYTAGAILYQLPLNQRASYRFVTQPDMEIVLPSTAANGVGLFTAAVTSAFQLDFTIWYQE